MKILNSTILGAALLVPSCFGAIIQPTAISSPQGSFSSPFNLDQIINQSGLSAGYVSGVTDFDTYVAGTTHDSSSSTNTGFTNSNAGMPQQITFDLGSILSIGRIAFWATTNIGTVTEFRLFADDDGIVGNGVGAQLGGTFNPLANGGVAGPSQVFSFGDTSTQFVHLYVDNTAGGTFLFPGIGEVAFATSDVPEPGTFALLGLGLAGIALRRKR